MTAEAHAAEGAMGWQERLWGRMERAGDWPTQMHEMVCMLTAVPFYVGAVAYGYFPFFVLGAGFTALAWLYEERRLTGETRLLARVWGILKRSLAKPWWMAVAAALVVAGVWREAVWMALVGVVVLRLGVRWRPVSAQKPSD